MRSPSSGHGIKILLALLALLIGTAAGFFATGLVRGDSPGQTWTRFAVWSGLRGGEPPGSQDPQVAASVLVGGSEHATEAARIALPAGTRFQLRLSSNRAGTLQLYAINPEGAASAEPIWQAEVPRGAHIVTPVLRLEGTTGLETLRVLLIAPGQGELARRQVQIWHQ